MNLPPHPPQQQHYKICGRHYCGGAHLGSIFNVTNNFINHNVFFTVCFHKVLSTVCFQRSIMLGGGNEMISEI